MLQSNIVPQTMTQLCSFCRVCSRDTDPTCEKTERKCAQTTRITYSECKYRVKRVLLTLRLTTISRLVRIGRGIQGIQSQWVCQCHVVQSMQTSLKPNMFPVMTKNLMETFRVVPVRRKSSCSDLKPGQWQRNRLQKHL